MGRPHPDLHYNFFGFHVMIINTVLPIKAAGRILRYGERSADMIRNAYLKKAEKRLHRLNDEIDSLGKKAASTEAEARAQFVNRIES